MNFTKENVTTNVSLDRNGRVVVAHKLLHPKTGAEFDFVYTMDIVSAAIFASRITLTIDEIKHQHQQHIVEKLGGEKIYNPTSGNQA